MTITRPVAYLFSRENTDRQFKIMGFRRNFAFREAVFKLVRKEGNQACSRYPKGARRGSSGRPFGISMMTGKWARWPVMSAGANCYRIWQRSDARGQTQLMDMKMLRLTRAVHPKAGEHTARRARPRKSRNPRARRCGQPEAHGTIDVGKQHPGPGTNAALRGAGFTAKTADYTEFVELRVRTGQVQSGVQFRYHVHLA
ncbi:hypothetical protein GAS18_25445 [Burkholderia glumae]|nr:hypothetical protein GAS18_25445 [Burkholderia glumae]